MLRRALEPDVAVGLALRIAGRAEPEIEQRPRSLRQGRVSAHNRPRPARLRISASAPNSQGGILSLWPTRFTSAPSFGEDTVTISPSLWVKPWPGASRSSIGADIVPRNSTKPPGDGCVG